MTRTVSVIAFTVGMVLALGFPVTPVAAEPGFVWGTAERIETGEGDAFTTRVGEGPQVAVDPQGNAVAVWHQDDGTDRFDIWANRFVPDIGWGTAERIETDPGGAFFPQVAMDPAGNAVAVWDQHDGTRINIQANRFVPGVGWGTAELIESDNAGPAGAAQVAVDSQGNAVAVWHQSSNIWANRFIPGVGWGTAELIESDAGGAGFPQVAADPQGNAVAVWSQGGGTRPNLWANRFIPGVGWGTAELIESDNAGPAGAAQVAVDSQGNAVAVWSQHDGTRFNIWANRFVPGVGWGTAELIESDSAGSASRPQVATDPQGNAVAVWDQHDGTRFNIWANRFIPGVGWGAAELIESDNAGRASFPQVAADPQGNAVAVWHQSNGTGFNIWANRFVSGPGWGTAELIETDAGSAVQPQVAADPQGNAVAVWQQLENGNPVNIWANRGVEVEDTPIPPEVMTFGVVGAIAAAAVGVALMLWRRRARGKEKA